MKLVKLLLFISLIQATELFAATAKEKPSFLGKLWETIKKPAQQALQKKLQEKLSKAIHSQDCENEIKKAIQEGADINGEIVTGAVYKGRKKEHDITRSPIVVAIENHELDALKALLKLGADPNKAKVLTNIKFSFFNSFACESHSRNEKYDIAEKLKEICTELTPAEIKAVKNIDRLIDRLAYLIADYHGGISDSYTDYIKLILFYGGLPLEPDAFTDIETISKVGQNLIKEQEALRQIESSSPALNQEFPQVLTTLVSDYIGKVDPSTEKMDDAKFKKLKEFKFINEA